MILVPMGDHKSFYLAPVVLQICDVRDHQVDAQHVILRERQSAVHHHDVIFVFKGRDVHPDLFQPS